MQRFGKFTTAVLTAAAALALTGVASFAASQFVGT
jgi:hypothetical protein